MEKKILMIGISLLLVSIVFTGCMEKIVPEDGDTGLITEYVVATKENDDFYNLAEYFAETKDAKLITFKNVDDMIAQLRDFSPDYLAIVLSPGELTADFVDEVDEKLRTIDSDPFFDVAYGIITSFTIEDGYSYVDKLLSYKTPSDFSIYGINQYYPFIRLRDWYGINMLARCSGGYGPYSICSDEYRATVDRIAEEAKNYEILNFGLHGAPGNMALENLEILQGSTDGLLGRKPTGEEECEEIDGEIRCWPIMENVSINLNAALVTAFACTTGRINGKPSVVHKEYNDFETEGDVNTSIVLSFLKSGALNYIAATHPPSSCAFPSQAIASNAILRGKPIGIMLKDFKNNLVFNKIFQNRTLEGKPKASDFTIGFIEFQIRNWVLFGDPSLSISSKDITPKDCIQRYEESSSAQTINGENYLVKNVEVTIKFVDENGTDITNADLFTLLSDDINWVSNNPSCSIHINLEGELVDYEVSYEGINERYASYFEENGIIENAGDELIVIVPKWVPVGGASGTIELNFSIKMETY